ncbi:MAG: hypothetical protein GY870_14910 [archaeon]|nr:hypothetical protein [archaeon]
MQALGSLIGIILILGGIFYFAITGILTGKAIIKSHWLVPGILLCLVCGFTDGLIYFGI